MSFAELWDLGFSSAEVFVGVCLIWLGLIEPLFPSKAMSVPIMTLAALLAAAAFFYRGVKKARRARLVAFAKMEAADTAYADEVG